MASALAPIEPTLRPARRVALGLGALAWMSLMEFFLAQAIADHAASGYSVTYHAISYLGLTGCGTVPDPIAGGTMAFCSPRHMVFNFGLAMAGALIAAGAVLTRPYWGPSKRAAMGLAMMAAGGVGAMMAGIWPLDVDPALHSAGAAVNFSVGKIGLLLLGLGIRGQHPWLGRSAVWIALINLAGAALYSQSAALGMPPGLLERLAVWPETLWLIVAGYAVLDAVLCGWGCGIKPLWSRS